jgi:hypothetical protein
MCALPIYTDTSGHIGDSTSPALGVLCPPNDLLHAAEVSLPFPTNCTPMGVAWWQVLPPPWALGIIPPWLWPPQMTMASPFTST